MGYWHPRGVFEVKLRDEGARAFAVYDGETTRPRVYAEFPKDDVTEETVRDLWARLNRKWPARLKAI